MNFPLYPLGYPISCPKVRSIEVIHGKMYGLLTLLGNDIYVKLRLERILELFVEWLLSIVISIKQKIMSSETDTILTIFGWFAAFIIAVIMNRKSQKSNHSLQLQILELENSNYHLHQIIDSCSLVNQSLHNFYVECQKFLILIYQTKQDESKRQLYQNVYLELPSLYQDIFTSVLKMNTWFKMSKSKMKNYQDYVNFEKELAQFFSFGTKYDSIKDEKEIIEYAKSIPWIHYQMSLECLNQAENNYYQEYTKTKKLLEHDPDNEKYQNHLKAIIEKHINNRQILIAQIEENLQLLCNACQTFMLQIQELSISSNEKYVKLLKPIGMGLPITEEPSHTTWHTDRVPRRFG